MKFVIPTLAFNSLITKCLNVVPTKATIPILGNLLIEAVNGQVIVTATDLTVGVRCSAEAKVLEEGSITLPAKRFSQLIRELTSLHVEVISSKNEIAEINANSSHFKINGMSGSEFPSLPNVSGSTHFKVKQSDIKDMLFRTAFAVCRDDNRYVLTGVHMQIVNGEASFSGTDGKRLSRSRMHINIDSSFVGNFIIPLKAVEEILKNLTDEGDATLYLLSDKIAVETDRVMIVTKLLTGDYPDISRIIPDQINTVVSLHREELMTLLRQVALFTEDAAHSVRFTFSNGELHLNANSGTLGEGAVSMPVNYQGDKLDIAFNPNFFLDILRHTKEETVSMGMVDAYNPGVITDAGQLAVPSAMRSLFVLMPMRLNEE